MSNILSAAACLCVLSSTLQASDDDCIHPPVQEVLPGKVNDSIRSVVAPSLYDCVAECKLSPLCLFFTFDPEKRACQLLKKRSHSYTEGSGIYFSSIQEWKMPLTGACHSSPCGPKSRCTVGRNGHPLCSNDTLSGMECTQDADCDVTISKLCFFGRCLCKPGYSHNIQRNSCHRHCRNYGDTMTAYKGLGISDYNDRIIEKDYTMEMCMSACVQETAFICKTIDFRSQVPTRCHLSKAWYLNVPHKNREEGVEGWWLAVRRCQE